MNESQSQEITRWHEVKTQERGTSRRGFDVPRVIKRINEVLGRTAKIFASLYFQLNVGHGADGSYLAKIGVVDTPRRLVVWPSRTVR